jgi:hypothetical protein
VEADPGNPTSPLGLILRKRLPQILGGYLASAWAFVEAMDFLRDRYGFPDRILQATGVSVVVGFFATSVLGWFHGEKGRQAMPTVERRLIWVLGLAWLVGIAWVVLA